MATVIETPVSFGNRAEQAIITLTISADAVGTVRDRARADVQVSFTRDDGRPGRTEAIRIALKPGSEPIPADSGDVIVGAVLADVDVFFSVAVSIWNAAVAKAQEDLTP